MTILITHHTQRDCTNHERQITTRRRGWIRARLETIRASIFLFDYVSRPYEPPADPNAPSTRKKPTSACHPRDNRSETWWLAGNAFGMTILFHLALLFPLSLPWCSLGYTIDDRQITFSPTTGPKELGNWRMILLRWTEQLLSCWRCVHNLTRSLAVARWQRGHLLSGIDPLAYR